MLPPSLRLSALIGDDEKLLIRLVDDLLSHPPLRPQMLNLDFVSRHSIVQEMSDTSYLSVYLGWIVHTVCCHSVEIAAFTFMAKELANWIEENGRGWWTVTFVGRKINYCFSDASTGVYFKLRWADHLIES